MCMLTKSDPPGGLSGLVVYMCSVCECATVHEQVTYSPLPQGGMHAEEGATDRPLVIVCSNLSL